MTDNETGAPAEDRTPSENERTRIIERASAELIELCHGKRWQMRIPADEASDSDIAFGELIRLARHQSAETSRLTAALDRATTELDSLRTTDRLTRNLVSQPAFQAFARLVEAVGGDSHV